MAPDVLIRVRNTKPQTKMENKYAREQNVFRAFEIPNAEGVRGRTVILLDDVTTTGSTLKDAARALKDAGASRVIMFAVAEA
jgi:predicted amidophosphoribosyltransferase